MVVVVGAVVLGLMAMETWQHGGMAAPNLL
jgi:hypothetical protein